MGRIERVGEQIKRELAVLLQREMADERINMITISGVTVSRDLNYSKVYFTHLGSEIANSEVESVLNNAAGFLRLLLSKKLTLRTTPQLKFVYDETLERGNRLANLIEKSIAEDNNNNL